MTVCEEAAKEDAPGRSCALAGVAGWGCHVRAAAVLLLIVLNLTFWICPLLVLVFLKWLLPFSIVQRATYRIMAWIYQAAVWCDSCVLFRWLNIQLEVEGLAETYPEEFYLVIANHQSWSDILILQHLLNRRAPVMKFLAKRELIYVPLIGLICWAYDFPLLHRRSFRPKNGSAGTPKKDTDTLNTSLKRFMRSTASIMNFAEGTRYSSAKALRQQSPHQHLLKPKAGGLAAIMQVLGSRLDSVVDFTLVYDIPDPSFWRFIGGKIRRVKVQAETIALKEIFEEKDLQQATVSHAAAAEWINGRWERKDREISRMMKGGNSR
jgi:1-acyl-sn-glycerol-3-phosphate acyltransferase